MSQSQSCDDCRQAPPLSTETRRGFMTKTAGALAAFGSFVPSVWGFGDKREDAESFAGELFQSLSSDQKKVLCFPGNHALRNKAEANWAITPPKIESFQPKQVELVERVLKGLSSPEGFEKFKKQMEEDAGGLGDYHVAFFGKPGEKDFEFVMSGRHVTMRADGNSGAGPAFGGPMVYGHQSETDPEAPTHPGNVFWYQALRANEVFKALDPAQRQKALCKQAPKESAVKHRTSGYPGLCVGEMSPDQKKLVKAVMSDILSPYRKEDADEVVAVLTANGGLEKTHIAFFQMDESGKKSADLGNDGVWDVWRLEGPGFVWHFRGAPHVHVWVNIARV
jgi:hypothetical protein